MTWLFLGPDGAGNGAVVYPLDDIAAHDIDNEDCACHPFWEEGMILVHRSFDRREDNELSGLIH